MDGLVTLRPGLSGVHVTTPDGRTRSYIAVVSEPRRDANGAAQYDLVIKYEVPPSVADAFEQERRAVN